MPRTSLIQAKTREHQHILHIDDGAEQRKRDEKIKINNEQNPIFWGYDGRRKWLFSHDAEVVNHEEAG
jgi:salicylate hydroxylase